MLIEVKEESAGWEHGFRWFAIVDGTEVARSILFMTKDEASKNGQEYLLQDLDWDSVLEQVILTGRMFVHRHFTIERRDGSACIAILRDGTTDYFTKVEALKFLEDFECQSSIRS